MRRLIRLIPAAAVALFPAGALAALPESLDRVPIEGTRAVIGLGSLGQFDERSSDLLAALELDAVSTFSQALSALGLREGINMRGSAAVALFPEAAQGEDERLEAVLILPVTDYAMLADNLGVTGEGDLGRFEFAGQEYFARPLDESWALLSRSRALVSAFPEEGGFIDDHERAIGRRGAEIASKADIVVLAPVRAVRPLLAGLLGPLLEGAPSLPLAGVADEDEPRRGMARSLIDWAERQGESATLGLTLGPLGARIDLAVELHDPGPNDVQAIDARAAPGLEDLPALDPMFAGSMNLTNPRVRAFLRDELLNLAARENQQNLTHRLAGAVADALADTTSASVAIYPPASLASGLLSRTAIVWRGEGAARSAAALRRWIEDLDAEASIDATLEPIEPEIAGVRADAWSIRPVGAQPDLLFGAQGGPSGYLFESGGRAGMIWGNDRALVDEVVRVREPLSGELMIEQVGGLLPADRAIEWYLDAAPILSLVGPMVAMVTGGQAIEAPAELPPIGASLSLADGSMHGTMFIPSPLIRFSIDMIERVSAAEVGAGRR